MAMQHGTCSMYTAGKCRCDACRQAMSEYAKTWRECNGLVTPDQLRTCDTCNQFYVAKLNSRQRFCNKSCAQQSPRILTCAKCGDRYSPRQIHHTVTAPVCDTCLADLVATSTICPICEIPWWAPKTNHCCGVECQELFDAKQQLVEASR
jgi:hypothetical protein